MLRVLAAEQGPLAAVVRLLAVVEQQAAVRLVVAVQRLGAAAE